MRGETCETWSKRMKRGRERERNREDRSRVVETGSAGE